MLIKKGQTFRLTHPYDGVYYGKAIEDFNTQDETFTILLQSFYPVIKRLPWDDSMKISISSDNTSILISPRSYYENY